MSTFSSVAYCTSAQKDNENSQIEITTDTLLKLYLYMKTMNT